MKKCLPLFGLTIITLLTAATAGAGQLFTTTLSGSQEVPPNASPATGYGTVLLDDLQTMITVNLSFSGLTMPASAAHIHGPANPGTNAAVLITFTGFPAATSGSYSGTFAITPTQVSELKTGHLYMNVHDANFPGGEIRGQLPAGTRSDFNGDHKSDVSFQNVGSGDVAVWLIDGTTITSGAVVASPATSWKTVATGDFNGHGKAGLLLQNSSTGDVAEWQMDGTVIMAGAVIASPGLAWKVIGSGDFNGDGQSDIVLQNSTTGDVAEWQMNGMAITAGGIVGSPGTAYRVVAAGDFDGDGKSDLVLQNSSTGDVAVWLLNGMTITAGAVLGGSGTDWKLIATGDFNGDGRADLLLQSSSSGDAAVWLLNAAGTAIASGTVLGGSGTAWKVIGTGDFAADRTADVVLQNSMTGDVAEWQLKSTGTAIVSGAVLGGSGTGWAALMN